jgi:hypothetical protein
LPYLKTSSDELVAQLGIQVQLARQKVAIGMHVSGINRLQELRVIGGYNTKQILPRDGKFAVQDLR